MVAVSSHDADEIAGPAGHDPLDSAVTRRLVALIEDEPDLVSMVTSYLTREGFDVMHAGDARSGTELLREHPIELLILDLGLPDGNGLDLLRGVRAGRHLPVIVLTGRGSETERVTGLELGADDYLVKPFSLPELAARMRAVLRRSYALPGDVLRYGSLTLDLRAREATLEGAPLALTPLEYGVLEVLAAAPRQVYSSEQLFRQVWRAEYDQQSAASVAEHVYRLRRKLGERQPGKQNGELPRIVTVRGSGYRLDPP
jgi:DNA-binding response OmpR family regulator